MATFISGSSKIVTRKDMQHGRVLMEIDTLVNACRMPCTGMEYTDGQVEMYITDNGKKF
jgi:hypothetical protein